MWSYIQSYPSQSWFLSLDRMNEQGECSPIPSPILLSRLAATGCDRVGFGRVPWRAYLWNAGKAAWRTCAAGVRRNVSTGGSDGTRGARSGGGLSHLKGSEAASAGVKRRANAAALPHASFRRTPLIREAIGSDAGACLPLAAVAAAIAREREEGGGEWGGIRCTTRARDRVW